MRYVANDGMKFDTEQECLDYEQKQMKIKENFALYDNFVLYNKDFNKIDINDTDNYKYLYIISDVRGVAEFLSYWVGFSDGLNNIGLFCLNDEGKWESVNDLIGYHKKEIDRLTKAIDKTQSLGKSCETCKYYCKSTQWCGQYNDTTYSINCALYKNKEGD